MQIGTEGKTLIKTSEGCAKKLSNGNFEAYPDPATGNDPWTIGYGSTGKDIHKGLVWSQQQCDSRFDEDAIRFSASLCAVLGNCKTNQNQFDAMASFAYNLGMGSLKGSTLLNKHKAGDYAGAKLEFLKWDKAGGHVMAGLHTRRIAESILYSKSI